MILNKIEILRNHPDSAVLSLFGPGYAAVTMGSSVVIWKCDEVDVEFNQALEMDSEDIPVQYYSGGELVTAFADNQSFQLKNSSKLFPPNSVIHPMYRVDDTWWCKSGRIARCDAPQQFQIDTDSMVAALDKLHSDTVYDGGISDSKSREEFRRIVTLPANSDNVVYSFSTHLANGNYSEVRRTLNLEGLEDDIITRIYKGIQAHPFSVKVVLMFTAFLITVVIYLGWTLHRWLKVRSLRKTDDDDIEKGRMTDKTEKLSKSNYFWAFFSHNKMDVNLNKRDIARIERSQDKMEQEVDLLNARLDSMETLVSMDTSILPLYNTAITIEPESKDMNDVV